VVFVKFLSKVLEPEDQKHIGDLKNVIEKFLDPMEDLCQQEKLETGKVVFIKNL
jgi:hypothetical protein